MRTLARVFAVDPGDVKLTTVQHTVSCKGEEKVHKPDNRCQVTALMPLRMFKYVFSENSAPMGGETGLLPKVHVLFCTNKKLPYLQKAWREAMQLWREDCGLLNGGGQVQGKQAVGILHKWNINIHSYCPLTR